MPSPKFILQCIQRENVHNKKRSLVFLNAVFFIAKCLNLRLFDFKYRYCIGIIVQNIDTVLVYCSKYRYCIGIIVQNVLFRNHKEIFLKSFEKFLMMNTVEKTFSICNMLNTFKLWDKSHYFMINYIPLLRSFSLYIDTYTL